MTALPPAQVSRWPSELQARFRTTLAARIGCRGSSSELFTSSSGRIDIAARLGAGSTAVGGAASCPGCERCEISQVYIVPSAPPVESHFEFGFQAIELTID